MSQQELLVPEKTNGDLALTTPKHLIEMAMSKDVDPVKIGQLMDLQMRWEDHEAKKAYIKALHQFRQNAPEILKTKMVAYQQVKYSHAQLDKMCEVLIPELGKYGLSFGWNPEPSDNGKIRISCVLMHVDGHRQVEATIDGPPDSTGSKNAIQAIGSTHSYLERYTLLAALGIAPKNVDDDGRTGESLTQEAVDSYMTSIKDSSSIAELKERYEKAKEVAAKLSDGAATRQFVEAKDARYKELRQAGAR